MSDFNLNDHVYRLLQSEPFFAALSRRIEKKMNKSIPTAGVRVNEDGYFEMVYNPDFFEPLTDKQRTGVLVHEFYHLVFEHVTGRLPDELAGVMQGKPSPEQAQKFKLWNIAADLSINYNGPDHELMKYYAYLMIGVFVVAPKPAGSIVQLTLGLLVALVFL